MKKFISVLLLAFFLFTQGLSAYATVFVNSADSAICNIRLGIVSGDSTADGNTSGNNTIYGDPWKGNQIACSDANGFFTLRPFNTEIGITLSGLSANHMYDLYVYWNGTAIQFDTPVVWPNISTTPSRQTVNGIVTSGTDKTRRLVGSFYATSATKTQSWYGARLLSNHQNRIPMLVECYNLASWTYGGGFRGADGVATTGVEQMGVVYDDTSHYTFMTFSGGVSVPAGQVAEDEIIIDGTGVIVGALNPTSSTTAYIALPLCVVSANGGGPATAELGPGYHFFGVEEFASASSTFGPDYLFGVVDN